MSEKGKRTGAKVTTFLKRSYEDETPSFNREVLQTDELKVPSEPHVAVGNLLGEDINNEQLDEGHGRDNILELTEHPSLAPAQFEQKWKSLPQSSCWEEAMMKLPSSPDELQRCFSKHHIALMASSPPGQSIQKYFFYAQQVSGQTFFLVEAVVNINTQLLRIVAKVEDSSLVQQFDEHIRTILEGEWIETK